MDWQFVVGLAVPTLLVIGLLIYAGVRWSRFVQKESPHSHLALRITMTGTVVAAFMVGFWVLCIAARQLAPESALGRFMQSPDGFIVVIAFSVFAVPLIAVVLKSFGYPIAEWEDSDE